MISKNFVRIKYYTKFAINFYAEFRLAHCSAGLVPRDKKHSGRFYTMRPEEKGKKHAMKNDAMKATILTAIQPDRRLTSRVEIQCKQSKN